MEIVDPTLCPDWDEMIASSPEHTFFHSSNWAAVLRDSYSYKPLYFTSREGSKISALIPIMEVRSPLTGKRGVALPFTDHCEPIFFNDDCFSSIFDQILSYGKKAGWKYLELRGGGGMPNVAVPYLSYVRHVLRIHDREEQLFRELHKGTKSSVRKAIHEGVTAYLSDSENDLREFYRLHCMTRKRHGAPPQPLSFFKAVHGNVISKGKGFTLLANVHGVPISGAVYFHSGKKAIYKYSASDLNYQHLRASNLVMWEAIKWFSKNGFEELCLGRTDLDNTGLIHFKGGWGAQKEPLCYYRYDLKRAAFVNGAQTTNSHAERFFRRLPVPILRLAGELLYKHMG